jgi:hypothetical protein
MKTQSATAILRALLLLFLLQTFPVAKADDQVEVLRNALRGQQLHVSFRDGGAMYGTFYEFDIQFCQTGRYFASAHSTKTTVFGNTQMNRWWERGNWDVISYQGQPMLKYLLSDGKTNFAPAHLLPGGRVWLGEGVSVQQRGTTACH